MKKLIKKILLQLRVIFMTWTVKGLRDAADKLDDINK